MLEMFLYEITTWYFHIVRDLQKKLALIANGLYALNNRKILLESLEMFSYDVPARDVQISDILHKQFCSSTIYALNESKIFWNHWKNSCMKFMYRISKSLTSSIQKLYI